MSVPILKADTIELISGQVIDGEIIARTDDSIKIRTELGIDITYFTEEIRTVNGGHFQTKESTLSNKSLIVDEQKAYEDPNPLKESNDTFSNTLIENKEKIEKVIDKIGQDLPGQIDSIKEEISGNFDTQKSKIMEQVEKIDYEDRIQSFFNIYPRSFWNILFIVWFLSCLPLMHIANLLQADNSWLAWIPGLHFLLLINLGERSRIWFLLMIAPVIAVSASFFLQIDAAPKIFLLGIILSFIAIFLIPVTLWLSIVEKLQRPKIIALFMSIPIINVLLIYYIAYNFKSFKIKPKSIIPKKKQKQIPGRF